MSRSPGLQKRFAASRRRLEDFESIEKALFEGDSISLMLCREGGISPVAQTLVDRARGLGVVIQVESEREMRRMSIGDDAQELIAFEGPPPVTTLEELMSGDGLVLMLVGLRYPGNVGFILRSAEVAGVAGVVVTNDWGGSQLEDALRIGMRANRFFPVIESEVGPAIEAATKAGRSLVALETSGTKAPWEIDWSRPLVAVVGGETSGIPAPILETATEILRIPTEGFIPSYNVQAAVAMILGERLRQRAGEGPDPVDSSRPALRRRSAR